MVLPRSVALTCDDMDHTPDDGHRYELIYGALVVTPSPTVRHQVVTGNLYSLLRAARPSGLAVFSAPLDFRHQPDTSLQPDVLVIPTERAVGKFLTDPPLLVVEVLSPSTRTLDMGTKLLTYARLGVPHYWIADPEVPEVVLYELDTDMGAYVESQRATGNQPCHVERPYPLTIVPADLLVP